MKESAKIGLAILAIPVLVFGLWGDCAAVWRRHADNQERVRQENLKKAYIQCLTDQMGVLDVPEHVAIQTCSQRVR